MNEKIIQIISSGEYGDKIIALTSSGRIFYQSSQYRNTENEWYEEDIPKQIKSK